MNEGFTPNRPPDEEPDPLLAALRQHLGPGFGQEPSPGLWAGIRQQLPAAAPRPWWLRARRLLPLLAGLLLVSLVLVRQAKRPPLVSQPAKSLPTYPAQPATSVAATPFTRRAARASTSSTGPVVQSAAGVPATPGAGLPGLASAVNTPAYPPATELLSRGNRLRGDNTPPLPGAAPRWPGLARGQLPQPGRQAGRSPWRTARGAS